MKPKDDYYLLTGFECNSICCKNNFQDLVNKCPNCGHYGQGNFCSNCGTKFNLKRCIGILEDGSRCQNENEHSRPFCLRCSEKIKEMFKTIKDETRMTLSDVDTVDTTESEPSDARRTEELIDIVQGATDITNECFGPQQNALKDIIIDMHETDLSADDRAMMTLSDEDRMELTESLRKEPGRTPEEMNQLRAVALEGPDAIKDYVRSKNIAWKEVPLDIGVIGLSGVGKSSFINAIRGLKKGQRYYADVGVKQTTMSLKPYPHPENPSLIFWDMPGVGTPSFPKKNYLKDIKFEKYEFFLIISAKRFREEDSWLAKEAEKNGKSCFFVRTHIDCDVKNDKRENTKNHFKETVLAVIRKDCTDQLSATKVKSKQIFLIDNYKTDEYDFQKLIISLIQSDLTDEKKRVALILSFSVLTKELIEEKRKTLQAGIWRVAWVSAVSGSALISGIGAWVNVRLLREELDEYRRQFGLSDERLQEAQTSKFANDLLKKYGSYLEQIMFQIAGDCYGEQENLNKPSTRSLASAALSYTITVGVLMKLLNLVADDAQRLREENMKGL